jgi:hypothetical protein
MTSYELVCSAIGSKVFEDPWKIPATEMHIDQRGYQLMSIAKLLLVAKDKFSEPGRPKIPRDIMLSLNRI